MRFSVAIAWGLCAGLLTGCYRDQNYTWHFVPFGGSTPAARTANEQAEAQYSDPWPDPNLSHIDPGMRPAGYEQPRETYPQRPSPNPIVVMPPPTGTATITAPYPSASPYPATSPGSFPASSPAPYPGATLNSGGSPYGAPIPGPAPAPYVLPQ